MPQTQSVWTDENLLPRDAAARDFAAFVAHLIVDLEHVLSDRNAHSLTPHFSEIMCNTIRRVGRGARRQGFRRLAKRAYALEFRLDALVAGGGAGPELLDGIKDFVAAAKDTLSGGEQSHYRLRHKLRPRNEPARGRFRLLVIDPDPATGGYVEDCFNGSATVFASAPVHAKSTADRVRPDLILIDPASCGRLATELLSELAEKYRSSVIAFTSQGDADSMRLCMKAGAAAFLRKSDGADELRLQILNHLQSESKGRPRLRPRPS